MRNKWMALLLSLCMVFTATAVPVFALSEAGGTDEVAAELNTDAETAGEQAEEVSDEASDEVADEAGETAAGDAEESAEEADAEDEETAEDAGESEDAAEAPALKVSLKGAARVPAKSDDDIASGTSGTCTWVISSDGTLTIGPTEGDSGTLASITSAPWKSYSKQITKVVVEAGVATGTTCRSLFESCTKCTSIDITNLDTSNCKSIFGMFKNCYALTEIRGLSSLNVSKATSLSAMFEGCKALTSIDISGWSTSNCTNMQTIFKNCSSLTEIKGVESLDTGKVTLFGNAFNNCSSLTSLDLSGWNTENGTAMGSMFSGCSALTEIKGLENFKTGKVTTLQSMFSNCSSLTSLDGVKNWDVSSVTNLHATFSGCSSLSELDLSNWSTGMLTKVDHTFSSCDKLKYIDISGFKTSTDAGTLASSIFNYDDALLKVKVGVDFGFKDNTSSVGELPYRYWKSTSTDKSYSGAYKAAAFRAIDDISHVDETWIKAYRVIYNLNADDAECEKTSEFPTMDESVTLPTATREGYVFKGWGKADDTADEAINGTKNYDELQEYIDYSDYERNKYDINLYAIWAKEITVTADDASKQEGDDDPVLSAIASDLEDGHTLASYTITREEGETPGTYTITVSDVVITDADGNDVTSQYSITYATGTFEIYEAPNDDDEEIYVLTYDPNGGNWDGDTDPVRLGYYYGDVATIYDAPERDGYVFVEWRGSSYQPGDDYTVTEDHTFTAIWEKETSGSSSGSSDGVDTGDDSDVMALTGLMLLAAAGLGALTIKRRREDD